MIQRPFYFFLDMGHNLSVEMLPVFLRNKYNSYVKKQRSESSARQGKVV